MVDRYVQSSEIYKGFKLDIVRTCLDDNSRRYNSRCYIYRGKKCIGIDKTKKSAKELIDNNMFEEALSE